MKKLLVAVDGSDHSLAAVDLATEVAKRFQSDLLLLHVVRRGRAVEEAFKMGATEHLKPGALQLIERISKDVLETAEARVKDAGGPQPEAQSLEGNVAKRILEVAKKEDVDLIVLGSRGREGLPGMLLGSVSHKVVSLAPCPTLVV